jgi:phage tail-like protein
MPANNGSAVGELNYITANRFYVEIESQITASFSECSGLNVKVNYDTYFEGGVNEQQRIFLNHAQISEITLKRGMTDDLVFWNWLNQTIQPGRKERRNVNILLFNQAGETMQCWTLIGAVPVGWQMPSLQASSSSVVIEELTLICEGLKVVATTGGGGASTGVQRDSTGFFPSN